MKIIIPKFSGFCPGVKKAEKLLFELINRLNLNNNKNYSNTSNKKCNKGNNFHENYFLLGPIIHNKYYIEILKNKGLTVIDEDDLNFLQDENILLYEENLKIFFNKILEKYNLDYKYIPIIRTHGIPQQFEYFIQKYFSKYIDLTCFKIKKIQNLIKEYNKKNFTTIISGKKNHPEVISLKSFSKNYFIIESKEEIKNIFEKIKSQNINKILLISQTTYNYDIFNFAKNEILNFIKDKNIEFTYFNTICEITYNREKEAQNYLGKVDLIIIIGDKTSSNSIKLYNFIKNNEKNNIKDKTIFIESFNDFLSIFLNNNFMTEVKNNKIKKIMIISSSSTPEILEKEIVNYLNNL
ncbi:MAG: hypothetical protein N3A58_04815 [Spirochaetes bacterium]|nr:hypothetical protein [Spirochaetota bacterium]